MPFSASTASQLQSEDASLDDVLDSLVDEAADVRADSGVYSRDKSMFAARDGHAMELRLGEEISEAAMRTPDTGPSTRGSEWVRFAPPDWDDLAFDRLEAWFRVAWRLAASRRRP